jgi:hypothetical protein
MADLQAQRVADGNLPGWLYYGLLAAGVPIGVVAGCGSGGLGTGCTGEQTVMAHELGHACGLPHAPCGNVGIFDPNYPAYEPYDATGNPQASIGEYGLDIDNGNIKSPAIFKDWMSYCGPPWISLYNYGQLTYNSNLHPTMEGADNLSELWEDIKLADSFLPEELWLPDPPPVMHRRRGKVKLEQVISIIGVINAEDRVEVKSVMRIDAVREITNGELTDLMAELVGCEGEVLDSSPLFRIRSHGCGGCGEHGQEGDYPYAFQVFLANIAPGSALRIRCGERELWSQPAPDVEPRILAYRVQFGEDQLSIEQKVEKATEELEYWLQWSDDGGKTWHGLASGLRGESAKVDASGLPSGRVLVRMLASDGFFTVESEPVAVSIPGRPPVVSIFNPRNGQRLVAGRPIRLWGAVSTVTGDPVKVQRAVWILDGENVAEGLDVFVELPPEGEHRLTLAIEVDKERTERAVRFRTVAVPDMEE